MLDHFKFQLNTRLSFGIGVTRKLPDLIRQEGFRKALILVDQGVADGADYFSEMVDEIFKKIPEREYIFLRDTKEPDYDYLDIVTEQARSHTDADVIIGIGGGSCLDVTKAVAVLMTNPGRGIDYRGFDKVLNPGIPTIAIPTTAGTGSEVTVNAVFTDITEMKKLGINGRYMNATYAILDAHWTMSCPQTTAVSSGIDAMTHALESYTCRQHNDLTRMYSKEAFRLLYNDLPTIVDEPDNLSRRQNLLLGSFLAGIALVNSGSGIAGAMSYPLGVHFGVPHGIGGGIFLTSVIEYNIEKGYEAYAELMDLIGTQHDRHAEDRNVGFLERMRRLVLRLNVPQYLNEFGIDGKNIDQLVQFMIPLQAAFDQNPVPFSARKNAPELLFRHMRNDGITI